jgi:hypothetical protein
MNKQIVLFHLKEALEELQRTVKEVEQDSSYSVESLQVAMGHLYHHLNTTWNGKDCTDKEFKECSDEKFSKWRKFPKDSELYLE